MKWFLSVIVLLLFIPFALAITDADSDTVPDESDMCPGSTPDLRALDAGMYAQNDIDSSFEMGPSNFNSEFSMATTNGCTCLQIAEKLGIDKNIVAHGCSSSMIQAFASTGPSVTGAVSYNSPRGSGSGLTGLPLLVVIVLGLFLINKMRKKK